MALSCLQIIQTVCRRIGILAPNVAIGSTDAQIIQLVSLSEEEGIELSKRGQWQELQFETTFLTVAAEIQTSLSVTAPGMKYIVNDTIWNRDLRRPVYGPDSEQVWQQKKAIQLNGPWNSYRVKQGNILFYPTPAAGQTCAFEYISENWISSPTKTPTTYKYWQMDSDTPLLDEDLIILGTVWRWKQAKGLDYAEDYQKYEAAVADSLGRNASKPVLNLGGAIYEIQPVVLVPRGTWNAN